MWYFKGVYSGETKAHIKRKEKKEYIICFLVLSIFCIITSLIFGFTILNDITEFIVILSIFLAMSLLMGCFMFISFKRDVKCEIQITNDRFYVRKPISISFAFYKIEQIEYYEDFIIINKNVILQEALLIEGSWEELKNLLEKIVDSLESDDPMYQIEEPTTEFFEATVKGKRIYKKFITGVTASVPVSLFQYFATFVLDNNEEIEYEIGEEWYEKIEEGQIGTLVVINKNFFSFGEGETIS